MGVRHRGTEGDVLRMRAKIARQPGGGDDYDRAMAAMALGDSGCGEGLARSLERHELLGPEANPGCTPLLDPVRGLRSYRELMGGTGCEYVKGEYAVTLASAHPPLAADPVRSPCPVKVNCPGRR